MNSAFSISVLAASLTSAISVQAQQPTGEDLVSVKAEASVSAIHPGDRFLVAVTFNIQPHWHIYWRNPGETGSATHIEVDAPEGFVVGDLLWPTPLNIQADYLAYGYEDEVTLFVPVTAPAELSGSETSASFSITADWLVCKESCLLGTANIDLAIPIESGSRSQGPASSASFVIDDREMRAKVDQLPIALDASEVAHGVTVKRVKLDHIVIEGPQPDGCDVIEFFPDPTPGVSLEVTRELAAADDDHDQPHFRVDIRAGVNAANTLGKSPRIRGVIALRSSRENSGEGDAAVIAYWLDVELENAQPLR
ncbi:MAG: protein-disulfide reductase DsbD domain-containing protein [Phycisphaerales bacterium]